MTLTEQTKIKIKTKIKYCRNCGKGLKLNFEDRDINRQFLKINQRVQCPICREYQIIELKRGIDYEA